MGNRFFKFYYKELQQIKCLYFSEWISAGLLYVKCLKITSHKLDENYIYQSVQNKGNILQQIYIIKQVLKPYLKYVQNYIPSGEKETFINVSFYYSNGQVLTTIHTNLLFHNLLKQKCEKPYQEQFWTKYMQAENIDFSVIENKNIKLKDKKISNVSFYYSNGQVLTTNKIHTNLLFHNLLKQKCEKPYEEQFWTKYMQAENIDFSVIYNQNIKLKDKKIAEFNYKVLNLILPCYLNLKRWHINDSTLCELCQTKHDIPHLTYFCKEGLTDMVKN